MAFNYGSGSGDMISTNNLSDVANPATALANLDGVDDDDARLTNTRTPTDGSVTAAKLANQAVTDDLRSVAAGVTSTVAAGYCRIIVGNYEIADTGLLEIADDGVLEIT